MVVLVFGTVAYAVACDSRISSGGISSSLGCLAATWLPDNVPGKEVENDANLWPPDSYMEVRAPGLRFSPTLAMVDIWRVSLQIKDLLSLILFLLYNICNIIFYVFLIYLIFT